MSIQQLAPTVRVFLDGSSRWSMRDLARRQSWRVDKLTAATAIAFMAPQDPNDVVTTIATDDLKGFDRNAVATRIEKLTELGVLRGSSEGHAERQQLGRWAAKGWAEPFDYLRATWDYPFEDYSQGGQALDRKKMTEYAEMAPDDHRFL